MPALITVAETAEYIRCALRLLSAADRMEVVEYLAANPQAGDLMQGTGGVRKLRWARGGRGKSSGVRVIYYWLRKRYQVLMLLIYPKSARDDLTADSGISRTFGKGGAEQGS